MERFKSFDVVSSEYLSFDCTKKTGLFLVLKCKDSNLLCAKITSQFDSRFLYYSVLMLQRTNPFLQCDSYIQLDKLHTIADDSCQLIGSLAPIIRTKVKNVINRFHYDLLEELNKEIRTKYRSPNK